MRVNAVAPGAVATTFTDEILTAGPDRAGAALFEDTQRNRAAHVDLSRYFALVDYLAGARSAWLTGRLLSARWDDPEALERRRDDVPTSSLFQLRRIDDDLFGARR